MTPAAHLLDYKDLARMLRLRGRNGDGWSSEAARALVNRHAELRARTVLLAPRKPRWRAADVLSWMEQHASLVESVAGCPSCCRRAPQSERADSVGERP